MRTIGIIGGMSWESTIEYYKTINQEIKNRLGGLHSGKIILFSVNFAEIESLQYSGDWELAGKILANAAIALEKAGAEFILIATNTMHKLAHHVSSSVNIPLLHIADATAEQIIKSKLKKVGLLGTKFTMEQDFYKRRLTEHFNIDVLIPNNKDREIIHNIIYNELCKGIINKDSRKEYIRIISKLEESGAQGIILGCTEIELLINQADCNVPVFPTAKIHAIAAVEASL